MIHDFQITEKYSIIPDLPLEFNPQRGIRFNHSIYKFQAESVTRYGFLSRETFNSDETIWIETEPHFVFHYVNCWDEVNNEGEELVVAFAPLNPNYDFEFKGEIPFNRKNFYADLVKLTFNLTKKTYTKDVLTSDMNVEFPTINPEF